MTNTVDVVIVAEDGAAIAAVTDAALEERRVLVVIRSPRSPLARHLRNSLRMSQSPRWRVTIVTGAEVACADGVNGVEAVVLRNLRTGRLTGYNARQLLRFPESPRSL